jgi:hypothetical protein
LSTIISEYLNRVKNNLRLDPPVEKEILSELETHIEDEVKELKQKGLHDEDAENLCLKLLGSDKTVARSIYESRSQGTWQQALMASLPHLLFGVIFILNWWRGIVPVLIALVVIFATAIYGWWHSRSTWLFPWLGYSLLPVLIAGLSLLYLPAGLSWVAIILYLPLAAWLVIRVLSQTIKKDWLDISLMLLPMPMIVGWIAVTEFNSLTDIKNVVDTESYYPWIGLGFLALALGVITFVRVRKRWMKISVLFMTGIITLTLVSYYTGGKLTTITFLVLLLLMASIFLIPALLENGVKSGKWGKIFEHRPMS